VLGFVGVLALLLGLVATVLQRTSEINNRIRETLVTQDEKATLVATLRDAIRERQVGLRDMAILTDPLEREWAWERYSFAASRFMQARDQLLETGLSDVEASTLGRLSASTGAAQEIQSRIVDIIRSGAPLEVTAPLLHQAIRAQDEAMMEMTLLTSIHHAAAAAMLDTSKLAFRQAVGFMLGLGLLAFGLALLIIILVLRRDRALRNELELHRNQLEDQVSNRTRELEAVIEELKSFSYSLAHDLRQPLRGLDGFSLLLLEDYNEALDDTAQDYLRRIRAGSQSMGRLLDGMLRLTRLSRFELILIKVNLSDICKQVIEQRQYQGGDRQVEWVIENGIQAHADESLMLVALENLLSNSWKFTRDTPQPRIEFGSYRDDAALIYYVKDNGVGFDMAYADKLFSNFGRLHRVDEFEGMGIGLATVDRIVKRHGGEIWANSKPGQGAVFYFTLADAPRSRTREATNGIPY